jgi:hypothetical protein
MSIKNFSDRFFSDQNAGASKSHAVRAALIGTAALAIISATSTAWAARTVRSLPHVENFDSNAYSGDLIWITQGATHTWMPNAGWRGTGAAKFTAPLAEGYSGLGQFMLSGLSTRPEQLNVRFLIYYGSTWHEYGPGGKLIIMNRDGNGGRPMVIIRDWQQSGGSWETWGACDGTVCRYEGGDFWPDGTDRLRIGNSNLGGRENEWISIEFEANTRTGMIRLYVDTQDQRLNGLYIERPMDDTGPGGIWSYIDIIGGYMNSGSTQQHPENYFMIDELVINSQRIGPPSGFTSSTRPNVPSNASVR